MARKSIEERVFGVFESYESKKRWKKGNILPNYILNRRIIIKSNGAVVFDNYETDDHSIPLSIQYEIRRYGYPAERKLMKNMPLIYNIKSKLVSINDIPGSRTVVRP